MAKIALKNIRILIFLLLFMKITACDSNDSELIAIGKQLVMIDSISDFSSNRNQPVPKIENIGEDLYHILRRNRDSQSIITIRSGDFPNEHKADYIMSIHRKNFADLGIRIKKGKTKYKILGYSGGYDW
jgi:hypothetical protein